MVARRMPDKFIRQVLEQAVAGVFVVEVVRTSGGTRRCPRAAFARQVAMYLAHVACGLTLTQVGEVFSRDRTTVAHACSRVEDLRDDAAFDRSLELLEDLRALSLSSVPFPFTRISCTRALEMSTAVRAGRPDAATVSDALKVLRDWRRGPYAAPLNGARGAGEPFGVYSARDGQVQPVATLTGSAILLACRRGWLAREAETIAIVSPLPASRHCAGPGRGASAGAAKGSPAGELVAEASQAPGHGAGARGA